MRIAEVLGPARVAGPSSSPRSSPSEMSTIDLGVRRDPRRRAAAAPTLIAVAEVGALPHERRLVLRAGASSCRERLEIERERRAFEGVTGEGNEPDAVAAEVVQHLLEPCRRGLGTRRLEVRPQSSSGRCRARSRRRSPSRVSSRSSVPHCGRATATAANASAASRSDELQRPAPGAAPPSQRRLAPPNASSARRRRRRPA